MGDEKQGESCGYRCEMMRNSRGGAGRGERECTENEGYVFTKMVRGRRKLNGVRRGAVH